MGIMENISNSTRRSPKTSQPSDARKTAAGALKLKDAATYLGGVSTITVRRLIKRGLIKPNRALRHVIIPVTELDRFINGVRL